MMGIVVLYTYYEDKSVDKTVYKVFLSLKKQAAEQLGLFLPNKKDIIFHIVIFCLVMAHFWNVMHNE